jgi:two-component system sensor histidine kinase/response regulator
MKTEAPESLCADILIVDDTLANLQLLMGMLKERDYKVRPALNGEIALQAARRSAPDLILLDINMPGLTGYEVAGLLKQDPNLCEIPIIFLSALNEAIDKVRAFSAGGVDYIVKPFQLEEVVARVETHLKIRRLQIDLTGRNKELEERNQQLRELQELSDSLVHMIVHDLRSPLAVTMGNLDLFDMTDNQTVTEEGADSLKQVRLSTQRLLGMVNSLLDVNKMEAGQLNLCLKPCDLEALGRDSLEAQKSILGRRSVELVGPPQTVNVVADQDLISRVLQNLVANAIKYAPDGSLIRLVIENADATVRVSISDSGCGIAPEHHARIFCKFGQVKRGGARVGTGLGLTFCKLAVEAHGGRIGVASQVGEGSTFWFEIPLTR